MTSARTMMRVLGQGGELLTVLEQLKYELSAEGYTPFFLWPSSCPSCDGIPAQQVLVILFTDLGTDQMALLTFMCENCTSQHEHGNPEPYQAALNNLIDTTQKDPLYHGAAQA